MGGRGKKRKTNVTFSQPDSRRQLKPRKRNNLQGKRTQRKNTSLRVRRSGAIKKQRKPLLHKKRNDPSVTHSLSHRGLGKKTEGVKRKRREKYERKNHKENTTISSKHAGRVNSIHLRKGIPGRRRPARLYSTCAKKPHNRDPASKNPERNGVRSPESREKTPKEAPPKHSSPTNKKARVL